MTERRAVRIVSIGPRHPGPRLPSRIEAAIDLGLKNDKLAFVELTEDEALAFADDLISAVRTVRRVNRLNRTEAIAAAADGDPGEAGEPPMHAKVELTGGTLPAHYEGAYPTTCPACRAAREAGSASR